MLKTLRRIADWVLLIAFVIAGLMTALDFFGVLDKFPNLKPDYPRICTLLIASFGASAILNYILSIRKIEEDTNKCRTSADESLGILANLRQRSAKPLDEISKISELTATIEQRVSGIHELKFPTKLQHNRKTHYRNTLSAIDSAPRGAKLDVFHFEKMSEVKFDEGEERFEQEVMRIYREKVERGDLEVRQIIHVSSKTDLKDIDTRLSWFRDCKNYSLNVIHGPRIIPYFDMFLLRDHWGSIDFSLDPVEAFRAEFAIEFTDPKMFSTFSRYFDIWWASPFSMSIKSRDGIHEESLCRLWSLCPENDSGQNLAHFRDFYLCAERHNFIRDVASNLIKISALVAMPSIENRILPEISKAFSNASLAINKNALTNISVNHEDVPDLMMEIVERAYHKIDAVSFDLDQLEFWNSAIGIRLLQSNAKECHSGMLITRIFIWPKARRVENEEAYINLMKTQADAGILIFYALEEELHPDLRKDFLIQDNNIAFEMDIAPSPTGARNGRVILENKELNKLRDTFKQIFNRSKTFNHATTKL